MDVDQLHTRQKPTRDGRHWVDDLGMIRGTFALPPIVGVPFVNRWDAETDRLWRTANRNGTVESREAYAADALITMLEMTGTGRNPARPELVLVSDLRAYTRGHAHEGEVCHIIGGGPIPVSVARQIAEHAFVKAVTHDGVKIDTVIHYKRHFPAELRTALELGEPPDFNGVTCIDEGCPRRYGLEWDHDNPVANNGPTTRANLNPRCGPSHRRKTERDRQGGLLGKGKGRSP